MKRLIYFAAIASLLLSCENNSNGSNPPEPINKEDIYRTYEFFIAGEDYTDESKYNGEVEYRYTKIIDLGFDISDRKRDVQMINQTFTNTEGEDITETCRDSGGGIKSREDGTYFFTSFFKDPTVDRNFKIEIKSTYRDWLEL